LEAARKKGRIGGRKPGLNRESQNKAYMAEALTETDKPVQEILQLLKISKATYYRYLEWVKENPYKGKCLVLKYVDTFLGKIKLAPGRKSQN
jgi:DNA invertase Pin-like site-specific DNA recombinase